MKKQQKLFMSRDWVNRQQQSADEAEPLQAETTVNGESPEQRTEYVAGWVRRML